MPTIDVDGLDALVVALDEAGFDVLGPRVRDGAVVLAPISGVGDLPRGVGDEQDAAHYRLSERTDGRYFGYASAVQGIKPVLFPAAELLVRIRPTVVGMDVEEPDLSAERPKAFIGARDCDLRALAVHDKVLTSRQFSDAMYDKRRAGTFVVAVSCAEPSGTCFCVSAGGGPEPTSGFDLALTELVDDDGHRFLVKVGTERGADILAAIPNTPTKPADVSAAGAQVAAARGSMGRELDTDGLHDLMFAAADSPQWDEVASRCLSCTNCTLVCPTCFCTSIEDSGDLNGTVAERTRVWDSCFTARFSYIHGGVVRESGKSRYRQWITHKLAGYDDQFGLSGCVGCGRCITWCPAAIDITAEAAALRSAVAGAQEGVR